MRFARASLKQLVAHPDQHQVGCYPVRFARASLKRERRRELAAGLEVIPCVLRGPH